MSENPIQKKERLKRDKEIRKLYPGMTMDKLGEKYGITRKRVSQIIKKVENK